MSVLDAATLAAGVVCVGFLFGCGLLGAVEAWDWIKQRFER